MYKKENHSLARINKNLIASINQWLIMNREIDERILTLRIDRLDTSKDLSSTKVYIYHENNAESLAKKLNKHHSHPIHQYLFQNLRIRRVPKIKFIATDRVSPEQEIIQLLNDIDDKS
ncbi:ribosome-binding factor A [Candidatus Synchoanobacter obligatus]|uniref:Ribosome-binding factor A n=1 Tax=Candidatus Synchoanobacter obligatus TaxID=2919597 RepID=A0ABT1L4T5_9GAMM|nr:ribosome-binding factor A [Candidatus Synchoanobacter obligatus]MCP8351931.1 ribosome-binding factor A [Candidatus Synchoanobacter obligatus]